MHIYQQLVSILYLILAVLFVLIDNRTNHRKMKHMCNICEAYFPIEKSATPRLLP